MRVIVSSEWCSQKHLLYGVAFSVVFHFVFIDFHRLSLVTTQITNGNRQPCTSWRQRVKIEESRWKSMKIHFHSGEGLSASLQIEVQLHSTAWFSHFFPIFTTLTQKRQKCQPATGNRQHPIWYKNTKFNQYYYYYYYYFYIADVADSKDRNEISVADAIC